MLNVPCAPPISQSWYRKFDTTSSATIASPTTRRIKRRVRRDVCLMLSPAPRLAAPRRRFKPKPRLGHSARASDTPNVTDLSAGWQALASARWAEALEHFREGGDDPEALEGIGVAQWWLDDADAT